MNIEISDAANESFVLNKECPSKTFHFTLPEFTFHINHVRFATLPVTSSQKIEPYFTINKLIDRKLFGKSFELDQIYQISVKNELLENEKINIPYHYELETSYKKLKELGFFCNVDKIP